MKRAITAMASALLATSSIPAGAAGGSGVREQTVFYSDAGFTNVVGEFTVFCDGSSTMWGTVDIHSTYVNYDCD